MDALIAIDAMAAYAASGLDTSTLASSSDSDGGPLMLLLLGPLAGIGFYTMIFLRYRNTDKRHMYEHETASEVRNPKAYDQRVDSVRGTERRRIQGDNSKKPTQRLGSGTTISHDA